MRCATDIITSANATTSLTR